MPPTYFYSGDALAYNGATPTGWPSTGWSPLRWAVPGGTRFDGASFVRIESSRFDPDADPEEFRPSDPDSQRAHYYPWGMISYVRDSDAEGGLADRRLMAAIKNGAVPIMEDVNALTARIGGASEVAIGGNRIRLIFYEVCVEVWFLVAGGRTWPVGYKGEDIAKVYPTFKAP